MKKPRKPKPMLGLISSDLLLDENQVRAEALAKMIEKNKKRRIEKRRKREARRLKHKGDPAGGESNHE